MSAFVASATPLAGVHRVQRQRVQDARGFLSRLFCADDLAAHALSALLARHPALDPSRIDDVIIGCANQAGEDNRNVARMALLLAGVPHTVPGETVNRLCASGLTAVAQRSAPGRSVP